MRSIIRSLALLLPLFACQASHADPIPALIPFQFHLNNSSGAPVTQPVSVRFSLYETPGPGGTAVWTESKAITPVNGLASTFLGDATAFNAVIPPVIWNRLYYVGVKVGSDPEMTPRLPVGAVPYAMALPNVTIHPTLQTVNVGFDTAGTVLNVNGDVRLGTNGSLHAASSYEKLRIVRGMVSVAGGVQNGSGFSVAKPSTGRYTVTFTPVFSDNLTITATASSYGVRFAKVELIGNSQAIVETYTADGTLADSAFHFIAVGPR